MEPDETRRYLELVPRNSLLKLKPDIFKIEPSFKDRNRPILSEKCWGKKEPNITCFRALKNTKTVIAHTFSGTTKRAFSPRVSQRDMSELILVYFILKEQRNAANHASDAKNKISYDNLSRLLENTAKFLKTV